MAHALFLGKLSMKIAEDILNKLLDFATPIIFKKLATLKLLHIKL